MDYRVTIYPSQRLSTNNDVIREINIGKECVSEGFSVSVCFDAEKSILGDEYKSLLSNQHNLILISCNFSYKTMIQDKKQYSDVVLNDLFSNDFQSFVGSMLSPSSDSDSSNANSDSEFNPDAINVIIGFLLYNQDILNHYESLAKIVEDVKNIKNDHPGIRIVLVLQGIRDTAIYFGRLNSAISISSSEIDELICQLLILYKVDTVESRDFNETFEFIFKTCNTIINAPNYHEYDMFRNKANKYHGEDFDIYEKIWINQLIQIPGLGEGAAKVISERYKTPHDLIDAILTRDMTKELEQIQVPSAKGHRNLGPVLAKRIVHLFYNIGSENDIVSKNTKPAVKSRKKANKQ